MTICEILKMGLINDSTEIWVRRDLHVLTHGNWYQDNVLEYLDHEQEDDNFYIDVK